VIAVVLLADGDFTTSVAVAVIRFIGGAISAFFPLWWKHQMDKAELSASQERERKLEEALAGLRLEPLPEDLENRNEEKPMDDRVVKAVTEFVNKAVGQLRQDVRDLKQRVSSLEENAANADLPQQVEAVRQSVAVLEQRAVGGDLAGAIDHLRREIDELKKRGSGSPPVALQAPARIQQEAPLTGQVKPAVIRPAPGVNPVMLIVNSEEARQLLQTYSHPQYDVKVNSSTWQVDSEGNVKAYSVCWLFCWGKAKGLEPVRHIFDGILDVDFADFDGAVDHEWARRARDRRDRGLETELSHMISHLPRKPRRS